MVLALSCRPRPAHAEPPAIEPWPETGETWMPEGVTIVERHWNQAMSAITLVYSADDSCHHHVVACLGCHFSAATDPDSPYSSGLKLTAANSYASGRSAGSGGTTRSRSWSATSTSTAWFCTWERATFVDGFGQHLEIRQLGNIDENWQRFGCDGTLWNLAWSDLGLLADSARETRDEQRGKRPGRSL
ncbi:hypothetical protein [Streptomyces sp. NPDC127197]|uniref:hypothetical protein n=1 Tax=Streptomyces sp. NPDC127197 TaxID=3345388 RepID=UPI0036421BE6